MPDSNHSSSPDFTVVICTRNRRDSLDRCLQSLALEFPRPRWNILVVDNNSSDGTMAFVEDLSVSYPGKLDVVSEEHQGIAFARRRGLTEANSEVVVYADDDVTFAPGWCQAYEDVFKLTDLAGAGGKITPIFPTNTPQWFIDGLMADGGVTTGIYQPSEVATDIPLGENFGQPQGANMGIRRQLALDLGSFRKDLGWGKKKLPSEETELFRRIHAHGGRVRFIPDAAVNHHLEAERMNLKHVQQWHIGYGRSSILMRPPNNPIKWFLKVVGQLSNIFFYTIRLHLPGGQRNFRAHRKQRQSMGRFVQLLGL